MNHPARAAVPTVSIVIPVYDVEAYLPECLESVRDQTFREWEAIIVVDGSPDDSEAIARRFAAEDARFSVIVTPNRGLGAARNVGLEHTSGEFVGFLDSDDVLVANALERLVIAARTYGSDIAAGRAEDLLPDGSRAIYWTHRGSAYRDGIDVTDAQRSPELLDDHVVWNKLYRRELIDRADLDFPVGVHCEDLRFSARAVLAARSMSIVPEPVYLHRRHQRAISSDYLRPKTFRDWIEQADAALTEVDAAPGWVRAHYVGNLARKQWWSRFREFGAILDGDSVAAFTAFTARLAERVGSNPPSQLGSLARAAIRLVAEGHLDLLRNAPNPFNADASAAELPERVLDTLEAMPLDEDAAQEFAVAMLTERFVRRVANASGDNALSVQRRRRLARLIDRVGVERSRSLLQRESVPDNASAEDVASHLLLEHEDVGASAEIARVGSNGVLVRGRLRAPLGVHAIETLEFVMRSQSSRKVRAFAAFHVPASTPDATEVAWQVRLPIADELMDEAWRCWLRVRRGDAAPREILIAVEAPDRLHQAQLAPTGPGTLRVSRLASTSLEFVLSTRRPAGEVRDEQPSAEPTGAALRRVYTFPMWSGNPYLRMLQLEARADGVVFDGSSNFDALMDELSAGREAGVVHLHWTSPIVEDIPSTEEAESRVDRLVGALEGARAAGRAIVWTIHNVLPHDARNVEAALRLHRELARLADRIHVLSQGTADVVASEFPIPQDKVVVIPHSSYHGVYGGRTDPRAAREAIGALPEATSVLFLGAIRPYKGIADLIDAVDRLGGQAEGFQLLLAGRPSSEPEEVERLLERLRVPVTALLEHVDDHDVANWLCAADVMVLPYRRVLNSGSMHLAPTFGVPCIVPDEPHLVDEFGSEPWVRFFDRQRAVESIVELLADRWYTSADVRDAALGFARSRTPLRMSRAYLSLIDELIPAAADAAP